MTHKILVTWNHLLTCLTRCKHCSRHFAYLHSVIKNVITTTSSLTVNKFISELKISQNLSYSHSVGWEDTARVNKSSVFSFVFQFEITQMCVITRGVQSSRYLFLYMLRGEKYLHLYLYSSKIPNRRKNPFFLRYTSNLRYVSVSIL